MTSVCTIQPPDHTANSTTEPPMPLEELEARICTRGISLSVGLSEWIDLIGEYDRREGWAAHGRRSCVSWLSAVCGLSPNTAREYLRVARALETLPLIRAAFTSGRLSYSKVRALTRIATAENEAGLATTAEAGSAADVERMARRERGSTGVRRKPAPRSGRYLVLQPGPGGELAIMGRIPAEEADTVMRAFQLAVATLASATDVPGEEANVDLLLALLSAATATSAAGVDGAAADAEGTHEDPAAPPGGSDADLLGESGGSSDETAPAVPSDVDWQPGPAGSDAAAHGIGTGVPADRPPAPAAADQRPAQPQDPPDPGTGADDRTERAAPADDAGADDPSGGGEARPAADQAA